MHPLPWHILAILLLLQTFLVQVHPPLTMNHFNNLCKKHQSTYIWQIWERVWLWSFLWFVWH
jgi:hypothetical protein